MQYQIMRKVILKRLALFLAFSILTLNAANMVLNGYVRNYAGKGRLEISSKIVHDNLAGSTGSFSLMNISQLRNELQDCDISYTAETGCFLEGNISYSTAKLIMTDESYAAFSGLDITRGSFFNADACREGKNLAIISEATAKELYSSFNIIGSDIVISGMKYQIAGIYRTKGTLLSYLGNDGMNRVYIPLESWDNYERQVVGTVYISGESIRKDEFRLHTIENILQQKMDIYSTDIKINDYYGSLLAMKGVLTFCIFCAGLYIMWTAVSGVFKTLKAVWFMLKKQGENFYCKDSVKACRLDLTKAGVAIVLELGMAYAAYVAVRFTPYLPLQIIPQENIFDFGFYAGKINEAIVMSNLAMIYFPSRLADAASNTFKLEIIFLIISVIMFFLSISELKLLRLSECTLLDIANPLIISVAASFLLTLFFSLVTGFELLISIKQVMVAITVVFAYIARNYKASNAFFISELHSINHENDFKMK